MAAYGRTGGGGVLMYLNHLSDTAVIIVTANTISANGIYCATCERDVEMKKWNL